MFYLKRNELPFSKTIAMARRKKGGAGLFGCFKARYEMIALNYGMVLEIGRKTNLGKNMG